MALEDIIISGLIMFLIIYLAVRAAISPLISKAEPIDLSEGELLKYTRLRDMGILDNQDLEDINKLYCQMKDKAIKANQYSDSVEVLKELKEIGYFDEQTLKSKIKLLDDYRNIP